MAGFGQNEKKSLSLFINKTRRLLFLLAFHQLPYIAHLVFQNDVKQTKRYIIQSKTRRYSLCYYIIN